MENLKYSFFKQCEVPSKRAGWKYFSISISFQAVHGGKLLQKYLLGPYYARIF